MAVINAVACVIALGTSLSMASACWAGTYPDHPVKIIVPFTAGGPSDLIARLLADKLSQSLKQQFYVENHTGAGGNIGMAQVARSTADGYTILVASSSYVVNPSPVSYTHLIGEAFSLGWRVVARCVRGREDGPASRSSRECTYHRELDLETLVCTRGRAFPLSSLESRLRCPRCGNRRMVVMFEPPTRAARA